MHAPDPTAADLSAAILDAINTAREDGHASELFIRSALTHEQRKVFHAAAMASQERLWAVFYSLHQPGSSTRTATVRTVTVMDPRQTLVIETRVFTDDEDALAWLLEVAGYEPNGYAAPKSIEEVRVDLRVLGVTTAVDTHTIAV